MARNGDQEPAEKPFSRTDETKQICRVAGYAFLLNLFLAIMKALLIALLESQDNKKKRLKCEHPPIL